MGFLGNAVAKLVDAGKYALNGSVHRRCIGGKWDGTRPHCDGLNQMHQYSVDRPPTILVRHKDGRIAQSNDGHLVVTQGSIVHLECLFVRRFGQPQWDIDNYSGRTYPQVGEFFFLTST